MNGIKHFELSPENQELINDLFEATGLRNVMQIKIIGTMKGKEVVKILKNGDVACYIGKITNDTLNVLVREDAFDRLDLEAKKLIINDAFNTIVYDGEKDKISLGVPSISVTLSGRQQYGDALLNAVEAGVLAIQQIEDEKRQEREEAKASKKKNS